MKYERRLNWKPDKPDFRDMPYWNHPEFRRLAGATAPQSIDLRPKMPPIVDQGAIGSCTGNAIAGMLGFLELQELAAKAGGHALLDPSTFKPFSRLFIYWNERSMEGDVRQDGGAAIRDGIKSIRNSGACSEQTWPYDQAHVFDVPSDQAFSEASAHKIVTGYRIDTTNLDEMVGCLANGFPFVVGISIYSSFMNPQVAANGLVPMPMYNDSFEGGHAVCVVGYEAASQLFIVRNSWGESWGDKGHFYLPAQYLTGLGDDAWTIRKE